MLSPDESNCLRVAIKRAPLLLYSAFFIYLSRLPSALPAEASLHWRLLFPDSLNLSARSLTLSSPVSPFFISIFQSFTFIFPLPAHNSSPDQPILSLSLSYSAEREWKSFFYIQSKVLNGISIPFPRHRVFHFSTFKHNVTRARKFGPSKTTK